MRFLHLVVLPAPAIWLLVALSPSSSVHSADALCLTKRQQPALLPEKQRRMPSIHLAAASSNSDDDFLVDKFVENTPSPNETKELPSSSSSVTASTGSATVSATVFNLVRTIIGAGVFFLPRGIALMGMEAGSTTVTTNSRILLSTSSLLIATTGAISAYTFSLIARVCKMTNSQTYADCWKATRGQSSAWIVALSTTLQCFALNLTYSMVLADTFGKLLSRCSRTFILLVLTSTALLPLCCIQNLSKLAPFSLVGIVGMVYTAFVIGLRCFDGSYRLPGGRFLADLETLPSFDGASGGGGGVSALLLPFRNPKSLILVSMLSTAYIAHFNAPKYYRELKDSDSDPRQFHLGVVAPSFAISVLFYCLLSSLGYLTFGSGAEGMILSNYSTKDAPISLSRFVLGLGLTFSYPLLFVGLKDGILDLVNQVAPLFLRKKTPGDASQPQQRKQLVLTDQQSNRLTVGLVSLITVLALKITNITFVASITGALLGTSLIFVFPPLMFRSALTIESQRTNTPLTSLQRFERRLCSAIVALGVFIAGVGTKMAWTS